MISYDVIYNIYKSDSVVFFVIHFIPTLLPFCATHTTSRFIYSLFLFRCQFNSLSAIIGIIQIVMIICRNMLI